MIRSYQKQTTTQHSIEITMKSLLKSCGILSMLNGKSRKFEKYTLCMKSIRGKKSVLGAKPQKDQVEHLEEINLNVVIRSNGQKRYFSTLMTVLSIFDREDLNAVYQLVMEKYQDKMPEGFDRVLWGDLMVLFNSDDKDDSFGMLKLKLESEEENTMALELIKFVKKILAELESEEHKNWLVHKQTACGKDFSNPFMVDNLPKIVRFSTHLASVVKSWLVHDQTVHALASPKANELAIPEQTATGKGTSNPLMAGECHCRTYGLRGERSSLVMGDCLSYSGTWSRGRKARSYCRCVWIVILGELRSSHSLQLCAGYTSRGAEMTEEDALLASNISVVYVLTTSILEDGENATME
ncbi:hypothetical protein Tco_0577604 [Tanacetum coccineum]